MKTLDEALVESKEGISKKEDVEKLKNDLDKKLVEMKNDFNYEKMQEQLNDLYKKMDPLANAPLNEKDRKAQERGLNQKWLRSLLRKDFQELKSIELQLKADPANAIHTGSRAGLDSSSDLYGGYLVPDLFLSEVNRWVEEYGIARRDMRYLPFSGAGNSRTIPTLTTGITTYWVDEGEAKTVSRPAFGTVTQSLKTIAALSIMTEEIIEDAAIDIVSFVSQLMGEAIAQEEDEQFLAGDTDAGDTWDGVINYTGVDTVAMDGTDRATDVTPEYLMELIDELTTAQRRGAKFYMHPTVLSKLRVYRAAAVASGDGEGEYLVQQPTAGAPASIWGYPIVLADALPAVSDASDSDEPFMFFGNLSRTFIYGDKLGLKVKVLDQATVNDGSNDINLAQHDMMGLRIHKRVGFIGVLPDGVAVLQTGPTS